MSGFVLASAALTLVTLALLLVPLLRKRRTVAVTGQGEASVAVLRDQLAELERDLAAGTIDAAAFAAAERGLKQRILEDAAPETTATDRSSLVPALVLALLLPLAAAGMYAWLGEPGALDPRLGQSHAKGVDAGQMESVVARLAQRLESTPDDLQGWEMLGRSYRVLGRHADAVAAFARAEKRIAADADRLTEWAESVAMTSGGKLAGRPAELIARALAADPDNGRALALAGAAAFERRDWKLAIAHWERLEKQIPADSEDRETVARSLAAARAELGKASGAPVVTPPGPVASSTPTPGPAAPQAGPSGTAFRLAGTVSLSPALAAKVSPGDAVFVFARAASGPPMPLAALRRQVKDLPLQFSLDESNAMLDRAALAAVSEVVVGARISRSGDVKPQSGDLQGLSQPVKPGASGIQIVINAALP